MSETAVMWIVLPLEVIAIFCLLSWFHHLSVRQKGWLGKFLHKTGFDEPDFYS